ncbi:hypothetical protein EYF80_036564 [Liparis tanakae]|uniref:Uncharacterized protein n=1 Tax=Liparis tanakae TaxID=230148 RepID=A0A4Z2GK13_9TELE|nr:hypothetical protein EYF80_036564 [Liparis tanakae]
MLASSWWTSLTRPRCTCRRTGKEPGEGHTNRNDLRPPSHPTLIFYTSNLVSAQVHAGPVGPALQPRVSQFQGGHLPLQVCVQPADVPLHFGHFIFGQLVAGLLFVVSPLPKSKLRGTELSIQLVRSAGAEPPAKHCHENTEQLSRDDNNDNNNNNNEHAPHHRRSKAWSTCRCSSCCVLSISSTSLFSCSSTGSAASSYPRRPSLSVRHSAPTSRGTEVAASACSASSSSFRRDTSQARSLSRRQVSLSSQVVCGGKRRHVVSLRSDLPSCRITLETKRSRWAAADSCWLLTSDSDTLWRRPGFAGSADILLLLRRPKHTHMVQRSHVQNVHRSPICNV